MQRTGDKHRAQLGEDLGGEPFQGRGQKDSFQRGGEDDKSSLPSRRNRKEQKGNLPNSDLDLGGRGKKKKKKSPLRICNHKVALPCCLCGSYKLSWRIESGPCLVKPPVNATPPLKNSAAGQSYRPSTNTTPKKGAAPRVK